MKSGADNDKTTGSGKNACAERTHWWQGWVCLASGRPQDVPWLSITSEGARRDRGQAGLTDQRQPDCSLQGEKLKTTQVLGVHYRKKPESAYMQKQPVITQKDHQ